MPNSDLGLDCCVPGGLGHRRAVLEESEWGGQTIFEAEKLDMVRPGGGVAAAHLENVLHHAVHCRAGVAPDVLKQAQCTDMEDSFNWEFTKKEEEGRSGRGLAQLEESSKNLVVE